MRATRSLAHCGWVVNNAMTVPWPRPSTSGRDGIALGRRRRESMASITLSSPGSVGGLAAKAAASSACSVGPPGRVETGRPLDGQFRQGSHSHQAVPSRLSPGDTEDNVTKEECRGVRRTARAGTLPGPFRHHHRQSDDDGIREPRLDRLREERPCRQLGIQSQGGRGQGIGSARIERPLEIANGEIR